MNKIFSHETKQIVYIVQEHFTTVRDMTSVLGGVQELMDVALSNLRRLDQL